MTTKPDYTEYSCAVTCTSVVVDGNQNRISPEVFVPLAKKLTVDFFNLFEHPKVTLEDLWGSDEIKAQVEKTLMCRYEYTDESGPEDSKFAFVVTLSKETSDIDIHVRFAESSVVVTNAQELADSLLSEFAFWTVNGSGLWE